MMKNHNGVIIVKAFFILGLLACFSGCSNPFFDKPAEPGGEIPAGKGAVRWSIESQIGRTLFPSVPFSHFELTFTATGRETVTETFTGSSGELMLEAGRWELGVLAYIGADPEPAAQGSAQVTVLGGRTNSVRVTLKILNVAGNGTGTLGYDITLPANLIYADLSAVSLDGAYSTKVFLAAASTGPITPTDPVSGQTILADGYYILTFTLRKTNQKAVITEVAHVYDGRTTNGVYNFSAAPFADAPEIDVPEGGTVILINSAVELAAINEDKSNWEKNYGENSYILGGDIDLSAYSPWNPLGDKASTFRGHFFGEGHTIRGLNLPGGSASYIGLFGYTEGARIEDFNVEIADTDITLTGSSAQSVGIVTGFAHYTVFKNLQTGVVFNGEFAVTKISGPLFVGGLAGESDFNHQNMTLRTRIEKCGLVGNIIVLSGGADAFIGGLVGEGDCEIRESYTVGLITHTNTSPGANVVTSGLGGNSGTVEDCYHNGNIRVSVGSGANLNTSGLCGYSSSRSYAVGSIITTGSGLVSGLSAYMADNSVALNLAVTGIPDYTSPSRIGSDHGPFVNNYALSDMKVNGVPLADAEVDPQNDRNGLGKTVAELQSQSTYENGLGWDFTNVWEMGPPEYPYPILKWQKGEVDLPDGYGIVELPGDIFPMTSLADMQSYLAGLSQNSPEDPYQVKLTGFNISDFADTVTGDPLGALFAALEGRYVKLDLSACGGTAIADTSNDLVNARSNKESLVSIVLPASLTSIGGRAFMKCSSLVFVGIPGGVTSIGEFAFASCSSLASIELPAGLTSIATAAFMGCKVLTSIEIPGGVTSIGGNAFAVCSSLASIELPAGLTSIAAATFTGCKVLTSIEIPGTVTSIGDSAFALCASLVSISLPAGLTSIGEQAFQFCNSLVSIELPANLTSIGSYAFDGCSSLGAVNIPNGITSIGDATFQDCSSLDSIELPMGLTSIGAYAFYRSSLTSFICRAVTPPAVGGYLISNPYPAIKVPAVSVNAYKAAADWSTYASKITAIP
jgi:hypothetical protein